LDHDPVGIGAIERRAAVAMNFEWMHDRDSRKDMLPLRRNYKSGIVLL